MRAILFVLLLSIGFVSEAFARDILPSMAQSRGSCNDSIKLCLAFIGSNRMDCFDEASQSPSCTRSLYKKILSLRTGKVDSRLQELTAGKLLDQKCVELFDGQLSSVVAKDSQNISELQSLYESISQCWVTTLMMNLH